MKAKNCTSIEEIFPQTQESKDEKIRKEIINIFYSLADGKIPVPINFADIFTWLEKQDNRKIQSEDEEKIKKEIIDKVCKWLDKHWCEYVWLTDNDIIHFGHWEHDLKNNILI